MQAGRVDLMEFVESLIALLCSLSFGLLIEWVLLRSFFKLMGRSNQANSAAQRLSSDGVQTRQLAT